MSQRTGLVLGGGGVLGAAWMVGALEALRDVEGVDAGSAEVVVGTSAGSVLAAMLGAGVRVEHLRDHQRGIPVLAGPLAGSSFDYERSTGSSRPPLPRPGISSLRLLRENALGLHRLPPTAVLTALLPTGTGSLTAVGQLVEGLVPHGHWAPRDGIWVVTMDLASGRRVVLGRPGSPSAGLSEAVMASCSIPAWYAPVVIGGRRYVDGGACSATSADLLKDSRLDHVYVLAPMASFLMDAPGSVLGRMERRWRSQVTRRLLHEVARLRDAGSEVTVLGPGPEDLQAMGANFMDAARRRLVLETSLRTSAAALAHPTPDELLPSLPPRGR